MIKWDLSQVCKDSLTYANLYVMNHINRLKDKYHSIISSEAEKASNKIQHLFTIKTPQGWIWSYMHKSS
jgi:hypothetical protein